MFKNKTVIVTGSSRGIGAATALEFGKLGANVVVVYKTQKEKADKVAEKIGNKTLVIQVDLTKEEKVKEVIKKTVEKFKSIDVLVNNAGEIPRPCDWTCEEAKWQYAIDSNLTSSWMMIKYVAPVMKKQGSGSIVNLNSTVGMLGVAPVLAYSVAKGGVESMTKAMAKELAPEIRVNTVAPSNVMTDMTKGAGDDLIDLFRQQTPLKRIADPEELAKAIRFLASDEASYITGHTLVVDGGYSLK